MQYQTFNSEYVHGLVHRDPDLERHFVTYFNELLLIKLRRSLRSPTAVEDVRQETFLRVFRVLRERGGLVNPEKLGAFVNGVCNNVLAEHYRAACRFCTAPEPVVEAQASDPDPEQELVTEENKRSVRAILNNLPAQDRRILHLLFIEEREKDEVCRICHVNRNYLRVLLHRAKNRFRGSLVEMSPAVKVPPTASFRSAAAAAVFAHPTSLKTG